MVSQRASQCTCRITRRNNNNLVFFMSYCKRSDDRSILYTSYPKKQRQWAYFLRHIAKRRWQRHNRAKKKLNNTIKRQEADRIRKRLLRKASEKLRGRLCKASNSQRSQRARCKIDQRCYVVDRRDWSHLHCRIEDNCGGNDHRPSYQTLNRYRSKRPASDGYCPCNNQPREQKSLAGRKKDGNKRTLVCCIARSNEDKGWLQQGMQDCTMQQPTKYFSFHCKDTSD